MPKKNPNKKTGRPQTPLDDAYNRGIEDRERLGSQGVRAKCKTYGTIPPDEGVIGDDQAGELKLATPEPTNLQITRSYPGHDLPLNKLDPVAPKPAGAPPSSSEPPTLYEKIIKWPQNNRLFAGLLFVAVGIIGLDNVTSALGLGHIPDAMKKIFELCEKWFQK